MGWPWLPLATPWFRQWNYPYLLSDYWANNDNVRKALHCIYAREALENGVVVPTIYLIQWIFDYHVNLSDKGYRSLIYSGDHDISIPFLDTQAWIRALNYSIVDDWRQWHTDDQVAGYSHNYS
ncbi:serine carboxypeptidase-like protein [Medicago truncatula]|uniref:Serine carboxypeptidase-like protein n=1 Tax=Medicago truncatula TaxID=3880 RepID=G7IP29_MEDTR|nr:serine carboxypeptidase-like protein [Medicago truncatula]